jgi:hypothetical protein
VFNRLFKALCEQPDDTKSISLTITAQRQKHSDSLLSLVNKRMHEKKKLDEMNRLKLEEIKKKREDEQRQREMQEVSHFHSFLLAQSSTHTKSSNSSVRNCENKTRKSSRNAKRLWRE